MKAKATSTTTVGRCNATTTTTVRLTLSLVEARALYLAINLEEVARTLDHCGGTDPDTGESAEILRTMAGSIEGALGALGREQRAARR